MTNVHYPNPHPDPHPAHEPNAVIAHDHITIGELTVPGICILADSVIVKPGTAELRRDGTQRTVGNQITLTLSVGTIDVEPDAIEQVRIEQSLGYAIDIALAEIGSTEKASGQ